LNVQKQDVGAVLRERLHGLEAVRAFADDLAIRLKGQQASQAAPRERFIVND
jgi:hypothetical protein